MQKERGIAGISPLVRGKLLRLSPFWLIVIAFAALKLLVHLFTASNYGYLCDELYAIDLSKHLAFGYVDMPPIFPALLALNRAILGDSLLAIHVLPALVGSATLIIVCLITRELGGKLFATALSAVAFLVTPFWLMMDSIFGYDSFDQLALATFLYVLIRLIRSENRKLWIALGLIGGAACMTKVTILYLAPGLLVALLVSKQRKQFLTRWPWAGLGVFLVLISPHLIWELSNGWPTLEYWGNYRIFQLQDVTFLEYMTNIVLGMNPLVFPLFLIGLYRVFRRRAGTPYGILGIMSLVTLVFLFLLKAKYFMLAVLFIPLLAAGSVFVEERLSGAGWRRGMRFGAISCLLAAGVIIAPSCLPVLAPPEMERYGEVFGFLNKPTKVGTFAVSDFPTIIENRIGWENLARTVAAVYDDLPEGERASLGIYADWFGLARRDQSLRAALRSSPRGERPFDVLPVVSWKFMERDDNRYTEHRWISPFLRGHTGEGFFRERTCLAGQHEYRCLCVQSAENERQCDMGVFEALQVGTRIEAAGCRNARGNRVSLCLLWAIKKPGNDLLSHP